MKYNSFKVGPVLRSLRKNRKITLNKLSEQMGISQSSIKQIEQGGRSLTMKTLFLFMEAYDVDANTILQIEKNNEKDSLDQRLKLLEDDQREYFMKTFHFMLDQAQDMARS